ncbi:MAG: hypothetical protein E7077_12875 [Bacteroidales bacterium]|jgi:surface polysaccharide O-acyltransferase-like enzyme|nr:hypothetical protein [Bacteroidales bacterium]
MKERVLYLDVVRIIACLMVIMMHSPVVLHESENSTLPALISLLMLPCNGLFFMTSGALLLGTGMPYGKFMMKRLIRLFFPVFVWSVVYIFVDAYMYDIPFRESLLQICWIPFHYVNANQALWFVYALLGCYFIVPIVEPWLQRSSKREVETLLLMWIVSIGLPMVTCYINIPKFDHLSSWYYLGGFFGYLLMGWYMTKYEISWKKIVISLILAFLFYVVVNIQSPSDWKYYCYLHPSTVCYSFGLFGMIMKLVPANCSDKVKSILASLSACSFGVYLIHVLFLSKFLKNTDFLDSMSMECAIVARWFLTTIVCFSIVMLLRKLPFSKYVIG